jgi:tRNA (adenine22-N1)-methyltransferase
MNIQHLSKRLETVVSYIPEQSKIADIGSDHAYLPCYAVNKGIASSAIAGEVVKGPYLSAKKQVEDAGLTREIEVRFGNGLEVIAAPGEVDCITIAGMGGTLIASILEAGKDKLTDKTRLILQPNVSAISIRTWLMDNEWDLIGEEILEEDEKLYEILIAEKGNPKIHYSKELEKELLLGPFLMKNQNDAFIKKWNQELHQWKNVVNNMEKAEKTEALEARKSELIHKINMVEEVLIL